MSAFGAWTRGAIVLASVVAGTPVQAQSRSGTEQAPLVELWAALGSAVTSASGDLPSSYSPLLVGSSGFTGTGRQTLSFQGDHSIGVQAGINVFPAPHAGVQILFDRLPATLSGANTPYDVSLTYISRQPPNDEPILVSIHTTTPWPDTSGSLTQVALGFNGVVRGGRIDRVSATASGGLSYYRLSGTVQPLGYTEFRLGGHSVLFSDEYHLSASLEPTHVLGLNAGADVNIAAGRHAAIVLGYRYLGGPTTDVAVRPAGVINADQVIVQHTVEEISPRLTVGPARVKVSGTRFVIGVKLRFAGN